MNTKKILIYVGLIYLGGVLHAKSKIVQGAVAPAAGLLPELP